jgi:parallel beta-helix repeat protein
MILIGGASGAILVSSCTTISTPGVYVLTTNISDSNASTCINITTSHVLFDGQEQFIDGVSRWKTYGVSVYDPTKALTNVSIVRLRVMEWSYGIRVNDTERGLIANNSVSKNELGITLRSSSNYTLINNTASNNTWIGINLPSSSNGNTLIRNDATLNGIGISLFDSSNNAIAYNNLSSNS